MQNYSDLKPPDVACTPKFYLASTNILFQRDLLNGFESSVFQTGPQVHPPLVIIPPVQADFFWLGCYNATSMDLVLLNQVTLVAVRS